MTKGDLLIREEIEKTVQIKHPRWLHALLTISPEIQNPFLPPDISQLRETCPMIENHPTGKLFLSPCCEMTLDYDDYILGKDEHMFGPSLAMVASSSMFFTNLRARRATGQAGRAKMLTLKLVEFGNAFNYPVPIIVTLFLYKRGKAPGQGVIVSDYCNLVPEPSQKLFEDVRIPVGTADSATFQVDLNEVNSENSVIMVLLSHPTMVDNGSMILKYYANPSSSSAQVYKLAKQSFPRNKEAWSTFAWSYAQFPPPGSDSISFQAPFFTEKPILECDIDQLLEDAQSKRLRQTQIALSFTKLDEVTNLVVRPLPTLKPQPILAPLHQLSLRLLHLKMPNSKGRNLIIEVGLKDEVTGNMIKAVRSKLDPMARIETEFSRCTYHDKCPSFDDFFLFDLPYPVPQRMALSFNVYHVRAKPSEEKVLVPIGRASLSLYSNDVLIEDNVHTVEVIQHGSKESAEKGELGVRTFLRSNVMTNNSAFVEFFNQVTNPAVSDEELARCVEKVPGYVLVTNLMLVLDALMQRFGEISDFSIHVLKTLKDTIMRQIEPQKVEKFLMIYAKYFAFQRTTNVLPSLMEPPISLIEQSSASRPCRKAQTTFGLPRPLRGTVRQVVSSFDNIVKTPEVNESSLISFEDGIGKQLFSTSPMAEIDPGQTVESARQSKSDSRASRQMEMGKTDSKSSFQEEETIVFFNKIVRSWTEYLRTYEHGIDNTMELLNFLLALIIKSLAVSKRKVLDPEFEEFCNEFSKAAVNSAAIGKISSAFAVFVNLLFDIGLPTSAVCANNAFIRAMRPEDVAKYVKSAFRPPFLLYSLMAIDEFRSCVHGLLKNLFVKQRIHFYQPIVLHILDLIKHVYDTDMKVQLASDLLGSLVGFDATSLPEVSRITPIINFFIFLLENSAVESFEKLMSANGVPYVFRMMHYLLQAVTKSELNNHHLRQASFLPDPVTLVSNDREKTRKFGTMKAKRSIPSGANLPPPLPQMVSSDKNELIDKRGIINSIFTFCEKFVEVADLSGGIGIIRICFHFMGMDVKEANLPVLFRLLSKCLRKFAPKILTCQRPCVVKVISRIFQMSLVFKPEFAENLAAPITAMFEGEFEVQKNNRLSTAIAVRSLSLMHHSQLLLDNFTNFMERFRTASNTALYEFLEMFDRLKEISVRLGNPKICDTQRVEIMFTRIREFRFSPDAQMEALNELKLFQQKRNNTVEVINITLLQATLVFEYLVLLKRVPNYYHARFYQDPVPIKRITLDNDIFDFNLPGAQDNEVPINICLVGSFSFCPQEIRHNPPRVPSFCDSKYFSELGLVSLIYQCFEASAAERYFEYCLALCDIAWPIFEQRRQYGHVESMFSTISSTLKDTPRELERHEEAYFRVRFIGAIFAIDAHYSSSDMSFVYRTRKETTLAEQQKEMMSTYGRLYGESKVVLLTDDSDIDTSTLDEKRGYIHIIPVKPTDRVNSVHLTQFYYDTTFTKSSTRSRASTYVRRTILDVDTYMPSYVERSKVNQIYEIEYPPIEVGYNEIRERTYLFNKSLSSKDMPRLQSLLRESLIDESDSVLEIASTFLSTDGDPSRSKLKSALSALVSAIRNGMALHMEWVRTKPEFVLLHMRLEDHMARFSSTLSSFL